MSYGRSKCMSYDHSRCTSYDHSKCIPYDHSRCMSYDHSKCMSYDHNKCIAYHHRKCMACDHSKRMSYDHDKCMSYDYGKCMSYDHSMLSGLLHNETEIRRCMDPLFNESRVLRPAWPPRNLLASQFRGLSSKEKLLGPEALVSYRFGLTRLSPGSQRIARSACCEASLAEVLMALAAAIVGSLRMAPSYAGLSQDPNVSVSSASVQHVRLLVVVLVRRRNIKIHFSAHVMAVHLMLMHFL